MCTDGLYKDDAKIQSKRCVRTRMMEWEGCMGVQQGVCI